MKRKCERMNQVRIAKEIWVFEIKFYLILIHQILIYLFSNYHTHTHSHTHVYLGTSFLLKHVWLKRIDKNVCMNFKRKVFTHKSRLNECRNYQKKSELWEVSAMMLVIFKNWANCYYWMSTRLLFLVWSHLKNGMN